ncbi:hypothetical protein [Brachybacterium sp. GCM10030252]
MVASRSDEAAAWLHVPVAAGGADSAVDPIMLARNFADGTADPVEMGAPCAAFHWTRSAGLKIVNDRLGMVRLYSFDVPGFGHVWSSRPGLAHVFGGLAPRFEQSTWNDMATLGWSSEGRAHLGNGRQLTASTRIHVAPDGTTSTTSDRDRWIHSTGSGDIPTLAEGAHGMLRSLASASWWAGKPIADLSGGKDSRVTAAAALRAGVIDAVRTVNTDSGEVETARELLRLTDFPVEHRVDQVLEPKKPKGRVLDRYISFQRAWEGAYNARSAYRTNQFEGFRPSSAPRINGLGGEAVQGMTLLSPGWREKLEGKGPELGRERLAAMIKSGGPGVTSDGIDDSIQSSLRFADEAEGLGMTTSFMVVDFFYNFSKMPYWSMPQATESTLLPFYAPQMIPRVISAMFKPSIEYGRLHRDILREILPEWSQVPFYKGSAKTRATPWMWENEDWSELSETILDGVSGLDTFSEPSVRKFVEDAEAGKGNVRFELVFSRAMWELSFREYAQEVARLASDTLRRVKEVRANVSAARPEK